MTLPIFNAKLKEMGKNTLSMATNGGPQALAIRAALAALEAALRGQAQARDAAAQADAQGAAAAAAAARKERGGVFTA